MAASFETKPAQDPGYLAYCQEVLNTDADIRNQHDEKLASVRKVVWFMSAAVFGWVFGAVAVFISSGWVALLPAIMAAVFIGWLYKALGDQKAVKRKVAEYNQLSRNDKLERYAMPYKVWLKTNQYDETVAKQRRQYQEISETRNRPSAGQSK